jgi:inhibitor of cysteine peptidase
MMLRSVVLVVLTVLVILALCACGTQVTRLGKADAGKSVELGVGNKLEIVLEGNPTTGYSWEVGSVDETVLKLAGEPEFKSESRAVGAGGVFTFRFEAVAAGQTALQLIYHRPFEKDTPPIETFEVSVAVKQR